MAAFGYQLWWILVNNWDCFWLSIEGFFGKRALGSLLKIETCQKRSKFHMQFCLGVLNNVLSVKFASFIRDNVKKYIFPRASSRDLLLNEKQKKSFVWLNDEFTIIIIQ